MAQVYNLLRLSMRTDETRYKKCDYDILMLNMSA